MFYLYFTKNVHLNQNVCWPCVAFLYFHVMWHTMVKLYNKLEIINNKLFLDVFFLHKLHKHTENCWKIYIFDFQTKLYSSLRDSWNQTYSSCNFIGTKFMGTICKFYKFSETKYDCEVALMILINYTDESLDDSKDCITFCLEIKTIRRNFLLLMNLAVKQLTKKPAESF